MRARASPKTASDVVVHKLICTKCATLLKGTSGENAMLWEGRRVEYSQRTPCLLLLLISALVRAGECFFRWRQMGRAMRRGSLLCWVRALEPSVTGHCQVGSNGGGRPAGLTRNAAALSVLEEPGTLGKKSKRLCRRHGGVPRGIFLAPLCSGWQI